VVAGLAAAAFCGLTAGPHPLALLRTDQIARLTIGPVHAESVVLGADPKGEGTQGPSRCLAVRVAAWRLQLFNLKLQLIEPLLQLLERSARLGVGLVSAGGHQPTAGQTNGSHPNPEQLGQTLHGPLLISPSLSARLALGQSFAPIHRGT